MKESLIKPIDKLDLLKQTLEKTFEIKNKDNNLTQDLGVESWSNAIDSELAFNIQNTIKIANEASKSCFSGGISELRKTVETPGNVTVAKIKMDFWLDSTSPLAIEKQLAGLEAKSVKTKIDEITIIACKEYLSENH